MDFKKADIKIIDEIEYKRCNICDEWNPNTSEYFYMVNKKYPEKGTIARCKKCSVKSSRQYALKDTNLTKKRRTNWTQNNKKRVSSVARKWKDTHNDQYKKYVKNYLEENKNKVSVYNHNRSNKNHKISKTEWEACKKYFDNSCTYCGITEEEHKIKIKQQLHKEHVIHDGSIYLDNCVPSCRKCNSNKWMKDMKEWYKSKSYFSQDKLDRINKWLNEDYKKYTD